MTSINKNNNGKYKLSFISDIDLLNHVQQTVREYSFTIDLKKFNKNIVDPIKLTFDKLIYKKTIEDLIEGEVIRQIDKSNNNSIGYFHQNIFQYIGNGDWVIPKNGFDIINNHKKIFVEMKNKHNTMNSSSSQKTYMKMQEQLLDCPGSTCMLVEIIATKSQNIPWQITLNNNKFIRNEIRRVSIDKFYELVTHNSNAFKELCQILPIVLNDAIQLITDDVIQNSVFHELKNISSDILSSLYLLAFKTYEGFDNFKLQNK